MRWNDMFRELPHLMVIALLLFSLSSLIISEETEEANAQEGSTPQQLNVGTMYLKSGMTLDPVPPDQNDEYQTVSIPNGFIRDGLLGMGILPFGHTDWKEVGSWSTNPLRKQIFLGGQVRITLFASKEGNTVTGNMEFQILRENEATPLISITRNSVRIQGGGSEVTRIDAVGNFPAGNDTTVEADTRLVFKVRAQYQIQDGGAVLRFGSIQNPAGFTFGSNALVAHSLYMDKESVIFEYMDAFMVPWVSMHTLLTVNGIEVPNQDMEAQINPENMTRMLTWPRDNKPGQYELFASVAYDPTGYGNVSIQKTTEIREEEKNPVSQVFSFITGNLFWILLVILILASPFLLSKWRKKVWRRRFRTLPSEAQSLKKRKKKKMWKALKKEKKKEKKAKKKDIQKKKEESESPTGSWTLFKKKPQKSRKEIASDLKDMDLEL